MKIKCACGHQECKTSIHFDAASSGLRFTDTEGQETFMYLDANTIVNFIKELRCVLLHLAD